MFKMGKTLAVTAITGILVGCGGSAQPPTDPAAAAPGGTEAAPAAGEKASCGGEKKEGASCGGEKKEGGSCGGDKGAAPADPAAAPK